MLNKPHTKIEQHVINAVREKRVEAKISQKELAYLLDVSIGFVGNIENPRYKSKYNLNHINKLADIFNCSPKDFLPENSL